MISSLENEHQWNVYNQTFGKENRSGMEKNNTYMGHDNVLIHVIGHDIVLTLDIIELVVSENACI